MTSNVDLISVEVAVFSLPPILHPLLSFKVRDRQNNGNLLLAEKFVKEPVIALKRSSESACTKAEQKQVNAAFCIQCLDKFIGILDSLEVLFDSQLRFLESDGIEHLIGLAVECDGMFFPLQRTALHARRWGCYLL